MRQTLTHAQARRFYDRIGAGQDSQAFYEDAALRELERASELGHATSVLEFGCGTGRLAERLLSRELPGDARYLGLDLSPRMVAIASERLRPYRDRAQVRQVPGEPVLPVEDASVSRVVSTYVIDLLSEADADRLLDEAARALSGDGRLCLVGITPGVGPLGRAVSGLWSALHRLSPMLVGGCRPLDVAPRLDSRAWSILHSTKVRAWGVTSEVLVARPRRSA